MGVGMCIYSVPYHMVLELSFCMTALVSIGAHNGFMRMNGLYNPKLMNWVNPIRARLLRDLRLVGCPIATRLGPGVPGIPLSL